VLLVLISIVNLKLYIPLFAAGWWLGAVRLEWCPGCRLQPGHHSSLPTSSLQPTTNQERNDQYGNQRYSRELLMMGAVVPETC